MTPEDRFCRLLIQTTEYFYAEDGIRVKKVAPSGTTYYLDKYTEITPSGVVRHIYAGEKLIASIDELGNITYNHQDHLGSSKLRTDDTGSVVKTIEHYPFGLKRVDSGSYNAIKFRFTSQYEDEESDLYYFKQRYYNPETGRFISADPLYTEEMDTRGVDTQELNVYAYVRNNPSKYIDPNGEFTVKVGWNIGGEAGVGASYSEGFIFSVSEKGEVQLGSYSTFTRSAGIQAGVGAGLELAISNADYIKQLEGVDSGIAGGGVEFYKGIGGGFGFTQSTTNDGKEIFEGRVSGTIGFGAGIGANFSSTDVEVIKDFSQQPETLKFDESQRPNIE